MPVPYDRNDRRIAIVFGLDAEFGDALPTAGADLIRATATLWWRRTRSRHATMGA